MKLNEYEMDIISRVEKITNTNYELKKFEDAMNNYINTKNNNFWEIKDDLRILTQKLNVSVETGYRWMKQHDVYNIDQVKAYVESKINDRLTAERKQKEEENKKARTEKIKQINEDNIKTYSDEEIKKAFEEVEKLNGTYESLKERVKKFNIEKNENKIAYENRSSALKQKGIGRWDKDFVDDEEIQKYEKKDNELWQERRDILAERDNLDKEYSEYMGAIAYYYLNKFEYEKDPAIDSCEDTKSVVELIKSKDWYTKEGNNRLAIENMDVAAAKGIFKCLERIFAIFPEQKRYNVSLKTNYSNSNTWACASTQTGITFNSKYYKNYSELRKDYDSTEGGFHPMGTNADDIVFHEYFHVMTTARDLASKIKQNVTKRLKMRGKKGGVKQDDVIRYGISEYATKNADEFGAECFCQALGSKEPTAFAIEVFKETLKYIKYMRGLV